MGAYMSISVREAAELVGMSKPGILKAIRSGKLSATKDQNGAWQIEPVELFRVYAPVETTASQVRTEEAVSQSEYLRTQLADKQKLIDAQEVTIRILQAQIEELRLRETKQLEDKQAKTFWQRLFGRGA